MAAVPLSNQFALCTPSPLVDVSISRCPQFGTKYHPHAYKPFLGLSQSLHTCSSFKSLSTATVEQPYLESYSSNPISSNGKLSYGCLPSENKRLFPAKNLVSTRCKTHSTGRTPEIVLSEEDSKTWEACRQALSGFEFTVEEEDKILGKAFGFVRSPYWGEEREQVVPKFEEIDAILVYLRGLGLSEDDISKVLKKFPEVVGCSLENELKINIQILENQWKIKGKSLRNLLLRNPKVLGYIVDCKGDCMALCTRCWVRF